MQLKYHMVTIEDLVPAEHFLRKLEAAVDLSFVYEETAHSVQPEVRPTAHRPGGDGEIPVAGIFVQHPLGAADRGTVRGQQRVSLVSRDRPGRTSAGSQHDQPAAASEARVSEGIPPSV